MLFALWNFLFPFLQTPYDAWADKRKFHHTIYQYAAFACLLSPLIAGLALEFLLDPYVLDPYLTSLTNMGNLGIGIMALSLWTACILGRGIGFYLGVRETLGADYPRDGRKVFRQTLRFALMGDAIHETQGTTYYDLFILPSNVSREKCAAVLKELDYWRFLTWTSQNRLQLWNILLTGAQSIPFQVTAVHKILFPPTTGRVGQSAPIEFRTYGHLERQINADQLDRLISHYYKILLLEPSPQNAQKTMLVIIAIELHYWPKKVNNEYDLDARILHEKQIANAFKLRARLGEDSLNLLCTCPELIQSMADFFDDTLQLDPTYQGLFALVDNKENLKANKKASTEAATPWLMPQLLAVVQKIGNPFVTAKRMGMIIANAPYAKEIGGIMQLLEDLPSEDRISIFDKFCRNPKLPSLIPYISEMEKILKLFRHFPAKDRAKIWDRLFSYLPLTDKPHLVTEALTQYKYPKYLPDEKEKVTSGYKRVLPYSGEISNLGKIDDHTIVLTRNKDSVTAFWKEGIELVWATFILNEENLPSFSNPPHEIREADFVASTVSIYGCAHLTWDNFHTAMSLIPKYNAGQLFCAFISGTHQRLGENSPIRSHLSQHSLYDRQSMGILYSFISETQKKQAPPKDLKETPNAETGEVPPTQTKQLGSKTTY